jgi:hypothetical protein
MEKLPVIQQQFKLGHYPIVRSPQLLPVCPSLARNRRQTPTEFPPSPFTRMPVYANLKADIVCGDVRLASEI